MLGKKIIYVIDDDGLCRNMIERLVKNEHGSFVLKTFCSCEAGYKFIMKQENFSLKEYPDLIFLADNLSSNCIRNFLIMIEKLNLSINKEIQVYFLLDIHKKEIDSISLNNVVVKGSIQKPVFPHDIFKIIQSFKGISSRLENVGNYDFLISKLNLLTLG